MKPQRTSKAAVESFRDFTASALFCPRCRAPQPVRDRLLLVLPDGELWEYLCVSCGASLGTRRVRSEGRTLLH
ncbi:MAG: cytoplasmic protein [Vicinamibacteria bacterium]|nr:cytoplasmic protein [Vicinamibacteria bacterium]